MKQLAGPQSSRINTETISSAQTVKYHLKSNGKSAQELFHRESIATDPVDGSLMRNMKDASKKYEKVWKTKEEEESRQHAFSQMLSKKQYRDSVLLKHNAVTTSHKAKVKLSQSAETARFQLALSAQRKQRQEQEKNERQLEAKKRKNLSSILDANKAAAAKKKKRS